jgi:hypothetical protein
MCLAGSGSPDPSLLPPFKRLIYNKRLDGKSPERKQMFRAGGMECQPIYTPSNMEGSCGRLRSSAAIITIMHPVSDPFRGSGGERRDLEDVPSV